MTHVGVDSRRVAWVRSTFAKLTPEGGAIRVARCLLLAALLTPLVVAPGFLFPYVTPRAIFFRTAVDLALGVVLFLLLRRKWSAQPAKDPVLLALVVFLAVQIIAALAGLSPLRSLFGDLERMWGVWGWTHLIVYYVLLRIFIRPSDWPHFLRVTAVVGTIVAAYGLLIAIIGPAKFASAQYSTVGNSGLFAACCFWTVGILTLLFLRDPRRRWRAIYFGAGVIAVGGLLVAQNRSTILAVLVAAIVFVVIRGRHRLLIAGVTIALIALVVVVRREGTANRPVPPVIGRIASTSATGDAIRLLQARVTLQGIRDHPVLGVGPENFDLLWSRHFDPVIYRFDVDERWDREHNAFLEAIATTGILGFLAFLLVWAALFVSLVRAYRSKALSLDETALCAAMYLGYASYLIFWFVDINSLIPWAVLTAFVSTAGMLPLISIGERRPWRPASSLILGLGAATLAAVIYLHGVEPLRVSRALVHVERNTEAVEDNFADLFFAFDSPVPQRSHTLLVYSNYMEKLAPEFAAARRNPYQMLVLDRAFKRGLREFDAQFARESENPRTYLQRARVFILAASFYGNRKFYELAERDLRAAMAISPLRIPPRLALSGVRLALGDTVGAVTEARRAVAIYPGRGESHFFLGQNLVAERTLDAAAQELMRSLELGYIGRGEPFREVAVRLGARGSYETSADLMKAYLERKYGALALWRWLRPAPVVAGPSDRSMLLRIPLALLRAGHSDSALVAAAAAAAAIPGSEPDAREMSAAVAAGKFAAWLGKDSLSASTTVKPPRM